MKKVDGSGDELTGDELAYILARRICNGIGGRDPGVFVEIAKYLIESGHVTEKSMFEDAK